MISTGCPPALDYWTPSGHNDVITSRAGTPISSLTSRRPLSESTFTYTPGFSLGIDAVAAYEYAPWTNRAAIWQITGTGPFTLSDGVTAAAGDTVYVARTGETAAWVSSDQFTFDPGFDPSLDARAFQGSPDGGNRASLWQIIPEPATLSLLILGGLAALRRRR